MAELVLDKSYLDAAPAAAVANLCETLTVLMSDELFFELMTTDEESRWWCFRKFPETVNSLKLIPNVDYLKRVERENNAPCGTLTRHCILDPWIFNRKLREGTYVCEDEALEYLNSIRAQIESDTKDFLERCFVVHQFFPELNGIPFSEFPAAVAAARRKIASDAEFVRGIYGSFLDEDAPLDAPRPDALTEQWMWFLWVQCQILGALRVFAKYLGKVPANAGKNFWTGIEHSMLDTYYVMHGALAGALATGDTEVQEDFYLIRPMGTLIAPPSPKREFQQFAR